MKPFIKIICLLLHLVTFSTGTKVEVIGHQGGSVTLKCPLQIDDTSLTLWMDKVWNEDDRPVSIFSSWENPNREISIDHPHRAHYTVDSDFSLTILNLDISDDPGEYICRSITEPSSEMELNYYLTVTDELTCDGESKAKSGDSVQLTCGLAYSGLRPDFHWRLDGQQVESLDASEIRLASTSVAFVADGSWDNRTYECFVNLGNRNKTCAWKMDVTYPTDTITLTPEDRGILYEGETLTCEANGNPSPSMTLLPEAYSKTEETYRSISVIVDASMEGRRHTIECMATNTFEGRKYAVAKNISFLVNSRPNCTGRTSLKVGETAELMCQMKAAAKVPVLKWTRDNQSVKSINMRDFNSTNQKLELIVSTNENRATYKCSAFMDEELVGDCEMNISVVYLSKNLRIRPQKEKFKSGDTIECLGDGNPIPNITLTVGNSPGNTISNSGSGRAVIVVLEKWEGEVVNLVCEGDVRMEGGMVDTTQHKMTVKVQGKKGHTKHMTNVHTQIVYTPSVLSTSDDLDNFIPILTKENMIIGIEPLRSTADYDQSDASGDIEVKEIQQPEMVHYSSNEQKPRLSAAKEATSNACSLKFNLKISFSISIVILFLLHR